MYEKIARLEGLWYNPSLNHNHMLIKRQKHDFKLKDLFQKPPYERCVLWEKPELVKQPLEKIFKTLRKYDDEKSYRNWLLKCRECGQNYEYKYSRFKGKDGKTMETNVTFTPTNQRGDEDLIEWNNGQEPKWDHILWNYVRAHKNTIVADAG